MYTCATCDICVACYYTNKQKIEESYDTFEEYLICLCNAQTIDIFLREISLYLKKAKLEIYCFLRTDLIEILDSEIL